MRKSIVRNTGIASVTIVGMLVGQVQVGQAGWNGVMNGLGVGWASANVVSSSLKEKTLTTATKQDPGASMPNSGSTNYLNGTLPNGSSSSTVARILGAPGYVWTANTAGYGGDTTDNQEIINRGVIIQSSDCGSSLSVASSLSSSNGNSGTISVDAVGTGGAVVLLRGFNYLGVGIPSSLDDLKINSTIQWDILLIAPFSLTQSNCNAIVIPFTGNVSNLYFVADGTAQSTNTLTLEPLPDVFFTCAGPAGYPPAQFGGGCGTLTLSYSPPVNSLVFGVPTAVTATVTDQAGNTTNQTFTATRTEALVFEGFFSPVGTEGTGCTKVFKNSELTRLGQVIPIKFRTYCNGVNYSATVPSYMIERCSDHKIVKTGSFVFVSTEWHGQFDTGEQGITTGVYVIHVLLQDGSTRQVAVKLK